MYQIQFNLGLKQTLAAKPKLNPFKDPQSVAAKVCFKPKLNCVWYVPCFDWKLRKLKNMRFNADRMFVWVYLRIEERE